MYLLVCHLFSIEYTLFCLQLLKLLIHSNKSRHFLFGIALSLELLDYVNKTNTNTNLTIVRNCISKQKQLKQWKRMSTHPQNRQLKTRTWLLGAVPHIIFEVVFHLQENCSKYWSKLNTKIGFNTHPPPNTVNFLISSI